MNVCCDTMAEVLHERDELITNAKSGKVYMYRINYRNGVEAHLLLSFLRKAT